VPTYIATGATCNPQSSGKRTSTGIYRLLPRSRSLQTGISTIGLPGASAVVTEVLAATAIRHHLLVGYGRMPLGQALLRGGMLAWGRRPWLGLRIKDLFFNA